MKFARGKVRGPTQDGLADELAAFANSAGGVLLLGVEDTSREVLGIPVEQLDAVELVVRQACEQSIKPPLAPIIGLFVHQSPGGYLHRIGSSKRPIPPDHLARLFQQRSQSRLIRFDETPVPRAPLEELDDMLWKRFAPASSTDAPEILLNKLAMAARDKEGNWRPTIAGLLMGSRLAQRHLPGAFIQAVAYQGTDILPGGEAAYQRDAQDITGPLDQQIMDACAFVR